MGRVKYIILDAPPFTRLLPLVAVITAVTTPAAPLRDNCSCLFTKVHFAT